MNLSDLRIDQIRIDGGTQSRVAINAEAVAEYAEAMTDGQNLPPVVVFFDGANHWLADGFHRYHANRKIGAVTIEADVRNGTQVDAKLFAYGANLSHGLRRTNADKRKAVLGMLADFGEWSDSRIAKHVGVHHSTVAEHRRHLADSARCEADPKPAQRKAERGGKEYTQNTENVGSKSKKATKKTATTVATPRETPRSGPVTKKKPAEQQEPVPDGPSSQEIIAEVQEENRALQQRVEVLSATDTKAALLEQVKRTEIAERRRDEAMEDAAKMMKTRDFYLRQLARCGKAVGEKDIDKIAPAVESFVRQYRKVAA